MFFNTEVADAVTCRHTNRGVEADDLRQVAYVALTRAARDFDPDTSTTASSHIPSRPFMESSRSTHFRDKGWTVRLPRRTHGFGGLHQHRL